MTNNQIKLYDRLKLVSPEQIEAIRLNRNGKGLTIPQDLVDYILQLDRAVGLLASEPTQRKAALKLQKEYPDLSLRTCQQRVADAMHYVYNINENTATEWRLHYAERLEELAELNMQNGDLSEARRCLEKAKDYMVEATAMQVDEESVQYRQQLISPDVTAERMGLQKDGIYQLRRRALELIEKQKDIPDTERDRMIQEVELELNTNN